MHEDLLCVKHPFNCHNPEEQLVVSPFYRSGPEVQRSEVTSQRHTAHRKGQAWDLNQV